MKINQRTFVIEISNERKLSHQFGKSEYTFGEQLADILPFKDFLGRKVPQNLYVMRPATGFLGNRSTEGQTPSTRKLSMDEGNRFCEKMRRAVKAYQLLNRKTILQYHYRNEESQPESLEDYSNMNTQQVLRIMSAEEPTISGQDSRFSINFGKLDEATIAVMLGWSTVYSVEPPFGQANTTTSGFGRMEPQQIDSDKYFADLSTSEKEAIKEFQRIYSLRETFLKMDQGAPQFLEMNGIKFTTQEDTFELLDADDPVVLMYRRPSSAQHVISISKKSYDTIITETPQKVFVPRGSRNLYASIEEFLIKKDQLRSGAAIRREEMTPDQALDIMSKPSVSAQKDEPWEDGDFVYVYVDSDYTLEQEGELYKEFEKDGDKYDESYVTRTLAKKALKRVFEYYKKDSSWKIDFSSLDDLNSYYGKEYGASYLNTSKTEPIEVSIDDDSLFDLEGIPPVLESSGFSQGEFKFHDSSEKNIDRRLYFVEPVTQVGFATETRLALLSSEAEKSEYWKKEAVTDFFIAPARPKEFFKIQYAIDRRKLNSLLSKGSVKVLNAVDAGIIAVEGAIAVYDRVAEFLEDPEAAFDLAEDKAIKAIEDHFSAELEVISEFKRDAAKSTKKYGRNAWSKLRKRSEKKRREKNLKQGAANNLEQIKTRNVSLLEGQTKFETRNFKKILDKVVKKMETLGDSFEDFRKETQQTQLENKERARLGANVKDDPFSAYGDFFKIKPDLNLKKEASQMRAIYGTLETFLKKNGHNFEDKFDRFITFKFEKERDKKERIIGSKLVSISYIGRKADDTEALGGLVTLGGDLPDEVVNDLLIGFEDLVKKPPFNNPRIMAYFSQLQAINDDLFRKGGWGARCGEVDTVPAMDFISKYVYPAPGISSLESTGGSNESDADSQKKKRLTIKSNFEEEMGTMFSQVKTRAKQFSEKVSITVENKDSLISFKKGQTYDANDLLPLGELCTLEEIQEKFLNTFDFKSYWCEFSACLPDIPWPIILDFRFEFPSLPKLPTLKELRILFDAIYISLVEMLIRFLCTLVNKLLDLIRLPNCDEVFEAALYGAVDLVSAIVDNDRKELPSPIGAYDISSEFLKTQTTGVDRDVQAQKKMLNSLTTYGIPSELISDPESGIDGKTMTDMMNEISAVMTPSEITGLLKGTPTPDAVSVVKNYIDLNIPDLVPYLGNEYSLTEFFGTLGGLIDVDVIRKIEEIPTVLAENRFCPEAVDARGRLISGDLTQEQLNSAITAHRQKSRMESDALSEMLKTNPLENSVKDIYNPGDPNALVSKIPGPMMDIIDSTTKSIFEVPRFSFLTDLSRYTDHLHTDSVRPLEYEDSEFNIEYENEAFKAIEILVKNENEIRNALVGNDIARKWFLRESLYEKFEHDVVVVSRELIVVPPGTQSPFPPSFSPPSPLNPRSRSTTVGATGTIQFQTKIDIHQCKDDEQYAKFKSGNFKDSCDEGPDYSKKSVKIYPIVRRSDPYGDEDQFRDVKSNPVFRFSKLVGDFDSNGSSLVAKSRERERKNDDNSPFIPLAPLLRKEDGKAIKSASDLVGFSNAEKSSLLSQITDSIVTRITELQNSILRHLETNLSDKNESAVLPIIRKYYQREEESRREAEGSRVGEFFRIRPDTVNNDDLFAFEISLPEEFNSKIIYRELVAGGNEDRFSVTIEDQILMGSTETFYGCDFISEEFTRPVNTVSLAKRHVYSKVVNKGFRDFLRFYRDNENISGASFQSLVNSLESSFEPQSGDMSNIFLNKVYEDTFEMFFEEVMDQLSDSRIFNDPEYIDKLSARIVGEREYDSRGCLVREAKGVIDFDKIVKNATSRVVAAFEDPSFHPSKAKFNAGSIGPFEIGIIHSCIYLMINFLMIEFALRGGIAFSAFSARKLLGIDGQNKTTELFRNYLIKFCLNSLEKILHNNAQSDLLEPFKIDFMTECIKYVKITSPDLLSGPRETQEEQAIGYVVDEIMKDGNLVDIIETIFQGTKEEHKSFAKSFVEESQVISIPSKIVNPDFNRDFSWDSENIFEDPGQVAQKGRFLFQHYIRVKGPAASADLSQYTFSPEFLSQKDEILQELETIGQDSSQSVFSADASVIADRIRDRVDELREVRPLPGAKNDSYTSPGGSQTEVVSFDELRSYLRSSYQDTFNEELCELLGLIYEPDPEDVCFLMPKNFRRFPGKVIKRNIKHYKIDRGFNVPERPSISGVNLFKRYNESWKTDAGMSIQDRLDLAADVADGDHDEKNISRLANFRYATSDYYNDMFSPTLVTSFEAREGRLFRKGIFSKCGRKGKVGNGLVLVRDSVPRYYVIPQDVCEVSKDFGRQGVDKSLASFSRGGSLDDRKVILSNVDVENFSKSYTPDAQLQIHDLKIGVLNTINVMNESFNIQREGHPSSAPIDTHLQSMEDQEDYKIGLKHTDFVHFEPFGMDDLQSEESGVFGWKLGELTQEEYNDYKSLNLADLDPLPNDENLLGPNDVYEEWTHYIVEDPGYVFSNPGESLHSPFSMGAMMDASYGSSVVSVNDEGVNDGGVSRLPEIATDIRYHWPIRVYHSTLEHIRHSSLTNINKTKTGYNGVNYGWGSTPFFSKDSNNRPDYRNELLDYRNKGKSKYDAIWRFNQEKSGGDNSEAARKERGEHRFLIGDQVYPQHCPMMSRPLGYQSEQLGHEDTNELGSNEYVCPVYVMVTKIDYKIGDTVLHSDTYIGSKFNDPLGIMKGDNLENDELQVTTRRKVLSEAVTRLTMEWSENTTRAVNFVSGQGGTGFGDLDFEEQLDIFIQTAGPDGSFLPGLYPGLLDAIILCFLSDPGYHENLTLRYTIGDSLRIDRFARAHSRAKDGKFKDALDSFFNGGRFALQYINNIHAALSSLTEFTNPSTARDFVLSKNSEFKRIFVSTILENTLLKNSQYGDFAIRPLSRSYELNREKTTKARPEDVIQSWTKNDYKTNMLTTSKVYSAAALLVGNNRGTIDMVRPPGRRDSPYSGERNQTILVPDLDINALAEDLMSTSIAVSNDPNSSWSSLDLFDFGEGVDVDEKILNIVNEYTEGFLNTRTYEGFWGYTSAPKYLRGVSFQELLNQPRNLGTGIIYENFYRNQYYTWTHFFVDHDTFPAIVDANGSNESGGTNHAVWREEYSLLRLPYPSGVEGQFAKRTLPLTPPPGHYMMADSRLGRGVDVENPVESYNRILESYRRTRGDLDKEVIVQQMNEGIQLSGFRTYLLNKAVYLFYKADAEERRFWNIAGGQLATPLDEQDTLANYGARTRDPSIPSPPPAGVFEQLNSLLKEEMSDRLQNIIEGSNYATGLRMVQVLSDSSSDAIDQILNSYDQNHPLRLMFDLLFMEERLIRIRIPDQRRKFNYVIPLVSVEESMDRCNLNWRNISVTAETMIPGLMDKLSKDSKFLSIVEESFPLQRFALLSGLYSVMALSTKEEFDGFMNPSKYSIANVFGAIMSKNGFERTPSGIEMWMTANGYMTSTGPKPPLFDVSIGSFFNQLFLNALKTPVIMLRNLSGMLDPAYKSMMKEQDPADQKISVLGWNSVSANGVKSRMKNGINCDGDYVPINLGFPRDVATNLFPIPNEEFFMALKKFGLYMYRKRRGGVNDSYGDFLGPFGALALSLPQLPGERPAVVAARKIEEEGTNQEACNPPEIIESSENNTEEE